MNILKLSIIYCTIFLSIINRIYSQTDFITTWQTTSQRTEVTIYTNLNYNYNYQIDWNGDGIFDQSNVTGTATHDYNSVGLQEIRIRGTFPAIQLKGDVVGIRIQNAAQLLTIKQWGTGTWQSFAQAFEGATNMTVTAMDVPNMSSVSSLSDMFKDCSSIRSVPYIDQWDVSGVTSMDRTFEGALLFNEDLGDWNVKKVSTMKDIFSNTAMSTRSYDHTLIGWAGGSDWTDLEQNVDFGANGLNYCQGEFARNRLSSIFLNWNITGDALSCKPFVTTWQTNTFNEIITIPVNPNLSGYSYDIDTNNDGTYDLLNQTGSTDVTIQNAGINTIRIRGDFPAIYLNNTANAEKLIRIDDWGDTNWKSMKNAFYGASNLKQIVNTPDLSDVSDASNMMNGCTSLIEDIGSGTGSNISLWDVSSINTFDGLFQAIPGFDFDLTGWDMTGATSIVNMLFGSNMSVYEYDQLLISWSTQNVQAATVKFSDFEYCMGKNARNILAQKWSFSGDIESCSYFTTTWRTTATNESVTINTGGSGADYHVDWNNDGVFDDLNVNGNITHIYASAGDHVVNIYGDLRWFRLNQGNDPNKLVAIDNWGDIRWVSMSGSFSGASQLELLASDVPDLSKVNSMSGMFFLCSLVNSSKIRLWDVSSVTSMNALFYRATAFDQNLANWDISNVTNLNDAFYESGMSVDNYDNTLISWATQNVNNNITLGAKDLNYCLSENARLSLENDHSWTFDGDSRFCNDPFITTWETTFPNEMITILINPNSQFMYDYEVDWNGDGIYEQTGVTGDVSHVYSSPGTHTIMIRSEFPGIQLSRDSIMAKKLMTIDAWGEIPWETMLGAFTTARNMTYAATDEPHLEEVTIMSRMFKDCENFNGDIGGWDFSNVSQMISMFEGATSFNQNLGDWDMSYVSNMEDMLSYTDLSVANYDSTLIGWALQNVRQVDEFGAQGLEYCAAITARASLIADEDWTIVGDTQICSVPPSCNGNILENTYLGTNSQGWNEPQNWSLNKVPNRCHAVTIPNGTSLTLQKAAECYTIDVEQGANFDSDDKLFNIWVID